MTTRDEVLQQIVGKRIAEVRGIQEVESSAENAQTQETLISPVYGTIEIVLEDGTILDTWGESLWMRKEN